MTTSSTNNKRIAKNTLMLYIRMLILMLVTLYTSRVVLNVLGVEDFGIYNLVGGIIVLFSFIEAAMRNSSFRFLSVAIGRNDANYIQQIFSACLSIHLIIAIILLIIGESIGLWFVNYKLSIPANRLLAANITYQIVLLTTIVTIIRSPYNAAILANEKMSFYAYMTIVEAILKLGVVYLINLINYNDKLVLYSCLLLIVAILIDIAYILYCNKKFNGTRFKIGGNNKTIREIFAFSWWNMLSAGANIGYQQGTNMIFNIFHGVVLNAAMGITNQIRTAVYSLCANLQSAANPQIIKTYVAGDFTECHKLIFTISKFSYYLILIIIIPVIINIDYILHIWLVTPPPHTNTFTTLVLIACLFDSLAGPLWTGMQANGNIKNYQILISLILILNLPISYVALYHKCIPESVLYIRIVISCISYVAQLIISSKWIKFSFSQYIYSVLNNIIGVSLGACAIIFLLKKLNLIGLEAFIIYTISSISLTAILIYVIGINKDERKYINNLVKVKLRK